MDNIQSFGGSNAMTSLKHKTKTGLFWSFISQGGRQVCQVLVIAVLARLLTPDVFGLLAMAVAFTEFVNVFLEMGIGSALIQKQDAVAEHYDSAFWLNIVAGLSFMVITFFLSSAIAGFYGQPKLKIILMALSINFIVISLTIVPQSLLTKEMAFKKLALIDICAVLTSGLLGIILAFKGFGVWSLVTQVLSASLVSGILVWILSPWRPRMFFSMGRLREIWFFGANLMGFNVLNYFARNMDKLLIGRFLGAEALGLYSLAYRMVLFPLQNVSWSIGRVMFPAFSKIQFEVDKVREVYLEMIGKIAFVTFPLMAMLFACAPEIVRIFLGDQWSGIVVLLRIFTFCGMVQSIGTTIGTVLLSQGKADWQFKLQIAGTTIVILSISLGMKWGVCGVATAYTFQSALWVIFVLFITLRLVRGTLRLLWEKLGSHFFLSILILLNSMLSLKNAYLCLGVKLVVIALSFIGGCILTRRFCFDKSGFRINI
ncbi:MAG: MOP flippase family protein [Candidatus Omnitrophica bacterium]|nr:MOP flippase family protein [Candidatus Omnitrophota bacterium]